MNQRARVQKIAVDVVCPDKEKDVIILEGDQCEGLFFSDHAVSKILSPFYKSYERILTRDEMAAYCGSHTLSLMEGKEKIRMTPQLVEQIWHLEKQDGTLPVLVAKMPACPIIMPEMKSPQHGTGRPKITGIKVVVSSLKEGEKSLSVDPSEIISLFWSDRTVLEILAPFYDSHERVLSRPEMAAYCGGQGLSLMAGKENIRITPKLVEQIWHLEKEDGTLPAFIAKMLGCPIIIPEMRSVHHIKAA